MGQVGNGGAEETQKKLLGRLGGKAGVDEGVEGTEGMAQRGVGEATWQVGRTEWQQVKQAA